MIVFDIFWPNRKLFSGVHLCPNLSQVVVLVGVVRLFLRYRYNRHNSDRWTNVAKGCEHDAEAEEVKS